MRDLWQRKIKGNVDKDTMLLFNPEPSTDPKWWRAFLIELGFEFSSKQPNLGLLKI